MRNLEHAAAITLAAVALVMGCGGGASGARPDDMSASAHERASQAEQAAAQRAAAEYDPHDTAVLVTPTPHNQAELDGVPHERTFNPTAEHRDEAAEHRAHAAQHEAAADSLRHFEAVECRAFPPETRAACPLLSGVTEVVNIAGGVRMHFAPDAPADAVLARIRCHLAYARTRAYAAVSSCPLYVRGVDARAGAGGTIELTAADAATVQLIRDETRMQTGTDTP